MKARENTGLTPKERLFVKEYLTDFNATAAYKRAGYSPGTKASGSVCAWKLLRKPRVRKYLSEVVKKVNERAEIEAGRILEEVRRLAFSDYRKLFDDTGSLKNPSEVDDETASAVAAVEVVEDFIGRGKGRKVSGYTKKVKLWDKGAAQDKLMRFLALYKDPGTPTNPVMVKVIRDDIK